MAEHPLRNRDHQPIEESEQMEKIMTKRHVLGIVAAFGVLAFLVALPSAGSAASVPPQGLAAAAPAAIERAGSPTAAGFLAWLKLQDGSGAGAARTRGGFRAAAFGIPACNFTERCGVCCAEFDGDGNCITCNFCSQCVGGGGFCESMPC
jgi:hypothetical protein